jgi:hypothetical protein
MTSEKHFNQYITKQFYEYYKGKVVTQRIETTTGNGVPDLLIITPTEVFIIESKFQTTKLRAEQYAWQIKTNKVIESMPTFVLSLCAYPKSRTMIVNVYDEDSISVDGIQPTKTDKYTLNKDGFTKFLNTFLASKLV